MCYVLSHGTIPKRIPHVSTIPMDNPLCVSVSLNLRSNFTLLGLVRRSVRFGSVRYGTVSSLLVWCVCELIRHYLVCHLVSFEFNAGVVWFGLSCLGFCLGLVWLGLAWLDLVWFVWLGLFWHGLVWHGLVWHGLVWKGLVWFGWWPWLCLCVLVMNPRANST